MKNKIEIILFIGVIIILFSYSYKIGLLVCGLLHINYLINKRKEEKKRKLIIERFYDYHQKDILEKLNDSNYVHVNNINKSFLNDCLNYGVEVNEREIYIPTTNNKNDDKDLIVEYNIQFRPKARLLLEFECDRYGDEYLGQVGFYYSFLEFTTQKRYEYTFEEFEKLFIK